MNEFTHPDVERIKQASAEKTAAVRALADSYAATFATPDGQKVLADLARKFGHHRPRFVAVNGRHDYIGAARIDGQCDVLREIEEALKASPLYERAIHQLRG